ncbi:MAG TPA: hypothetical protein VI259_12755, partial [Gemmatimonadaceae bacterium]
NYEAGGMDYQSIERFDGWVARRENRDRLLPHARCILAFRVRRHEKERKVNLSNFIQVLAEKEADKQTFLYMRNGEQLFRLSTEIEFGEQLFPNMDRQILNAGTLWAKMSGRRVEEIITDDEYQGAVDDHARHEAEKGALPEKDQWKYYCPGDCRFRFRGFDTYVKYDPGTVYYDDITKFISDEIARHNRLVLVLQGILDRSPVMHPHPPWRLWERDGFEAAIRLVYDDTRALTPGEKPDFEAYRARLNESLRPGSITIGQHRAWIYAEAEKFNNDKRRSWNDRGVDPRFWSGPYGNPGPGEIARVTKCTRSGRCTFEWQRERAWRADNYWERKNNPHIKSTFTCESSKLLNVDAYTPGDFKIFFADPRTREEYLEWAPLLLEAEEYKAGNRRVEHDPEPEKKGSRK